MQMLFDERFYENQTNKFLNEEATNTDDIRKYTIVDVCACVHVLNVYMYTND